ncbi:MAG: DUF2849 domain-containing protein [Alphaproteobacteria bacterium HGW-Alphaproteobacteria-13]|jgi:hypothetical protein|nr:MAG: DUF2849 domain-containing protein [Alphaproteobacteria bacterium HGW-Alphaproteobacteria-13]
MRILTGNDLKTGAVIWWTGQDWSLHVEDASDVGDHGEAVLAREDGARRVNGGYIVDAEATPKGPRPAHIKDRIRALGPTVRPDLTLKPADPTAGDWVI